MFGHARCQHRLIGRKRKEFSMEEVKAEPDVKAEPGIKDEPAIKAEPKAEDLAEPAGPAIDRAEVVARLKAILPEVDLASTTGEDRAGR